MNLADGQAEAISDRGVNTCGDVEARDSMAHWSLGVVSRAGPLKEVRMRGRLMLGIVPKALSGTLFHRLFCGFPSPQQHCLRKAFPDHLAERNSPHPC